MGERVWVGVLGALRVPLTVGVLVLLAVAVGESMSVVEREEPREGETVRDARVGVAEGDAVAALGVGEGVPVWASAGSVYVMFSPTEAKPPLVEEPYWPRRSVKLELPVTGNDTEDARLLSEHEPVSSLPATQPNELAVFPQPVPTKSTVSEPPVATVQVVITMVPPKRMPGAKPNVKATLLPWKLGLALMLIPVAQVEDGNIPTPELAGVAPLHKAGEPAATESVARG